VGNAEKHGKSEAKLNTVGLWRIDCCDTLEGLRGLPDNSIQCCVTSPPYFGLRDYGMPGQIGLEPTPQEYVARMVGVFEEVRRVLREDGTFWLNVGDSYSNDGKWGGATGGKHVKGLHGSLVGRARRHTGLKPKDLIGIPWMLAFALRDAGWYLRSEIIWHKLAPMPESVRDRPTKAHEQVFLLTKSPRYFYDHVGSAEKASRGWAGSKFNKGKTDGHLLGRSSAKARAESDTRNMRSVWRLSPESFKGAHFATMPTELARRCIVAGTSERGCCPACGKCWERVIEKNRVPTRPALNSKVIAQVSPHEDSPTFAESPTVA
jgi:DNA modification methylase